MNNTHQIDVQAIAEIRKQTTLAENEADSSFFITACLSNVVIMPPNSLAIQGRDAAVDFMRAFFDQFDMSIEYVSEETTIKGDIALDRGTYNQTLTPKGGDEPLRENGKFLWVYSREPGNAWKFSHVIWNSSEPFSAHVE